MLSIKLGIELEWSDDDWLDYYYLTDDIVDAAVLWKENSYVPNTFMCVSFQDDKEAAYELKKMSYDGRLPDSPWATQNINSMGYHYYMTPETANLGLEKLPDAIKNKPKQWTIADWPDLTKMEIFK